MVCAGSAVVAAWGLFRESGRRWAPVALGARSRPPQYAPHDLYSRPADRRATPNILPCHHPFHPDHSYHRLTASPPRRLTPTPGLTLHQESVRAIIGRSDELQNMVRVCDNATQQYKRTRPDPSARSIRRAKELVTHVVHPLVLAHEHMKLGEWSGPTIGPV